VEAGQRYGFQRIDRKRLIVPALAHPDQLHGMAPLAQTLDPSGDGQGDAINFRRIGFRDDADAQSATERVKVWLDSHAPDFPGRRQQRNDSLMKE
jgi:hypothetical protein